MTQQDLQRGTFATHCAVTLGVGFLSLQGLGPGWSLLATLPLLALLPGVYRSLLPRLRLAAIMLVPYLTVAVMEAIANTELRTWAAALMFGLLIELSLLILLIRTVQIQAVRQHAADKRHS